MRKNQKYVGRISIILILIASCTKDANPPAPEDVPIATLMSNVTTNIGFIAGSDVHRITSIWCQQFSGQGGASSTTIRIERYNIQSTDLVTLWSNYYSFVLADVEIIMSKSKELPYYNGIAKIIKAWCFVQIVDVWGDVPFTEAFKTIEVRFPKYDKAEEIYPALVSLLNEGVAQLSTPSSTNPPSTDDGIYGGNIAKWIKMANTLKLRIALHYSEIDAAKTRTDIEEIINSNAPVISSNDDNFQARFFDAPNAQNPIHQAESRSSDQFFPNSFLVNMMNAKSDPRRPFYFTPFPYNSSPATYKGATPGDAQSRNYSRLHTYLRGNLKNSPVPNPDGSLRSDAAVYTGTAPIRMLTAAEYYFIRAEASLRFGAPGDAQALYQDGIRRSMEATGVGDTEINDYIVAHGILTGTDAEKLKQIIEEKFVALYGVAIEPYSDWRRTGLPEITEVPNSIYPGKGIATIFWYAQIEINANPNVKQRPSLFEKVFWDK